LTYESSSEAKTEVMAEVVEVAVVREVVALDEVQESVRDEDNEDAGDDSWFSCCK
jgi:hypothetical protein